MPEHRRQIARKNKEKVFYYLEIQMIGNTIKSKEKER